MALSRYKISAFWCVLSVYLVLFVKFYNAQVTNFRSVNYMEDGEMETLISYNGISAKEISVANKSESGLALRQITDGKRFLQLIFDDEMLKDCQYILEKNQIESFLDSFNRSDLYSLTSTSKIVVENLNDRPLPRDIKRWFRFNRLKKLCHRIRRDMRSKLMRIEETNKEELESRNKFGRSSRKRRSFQFLLPGSNWCGDANRAKGYTDLSMFWRTDKCCRTHDFCRMGIEGFSMRYGLFNPRPFTISHCKCDDRSKRDLSDIFRLPGTQWCGKGYSATKYTELGIFSRTDRCCRQHDLACPFWIGGLQTKYGVHNFMVNTLMHCSCDERFRGCLKRVGTTDANIVGNIFFNYVQRECFTLEPRKLCNKKYHAHQKRAKGKWRKKKDLNGRRTKRNEKKCRKRNLERKAVIRRNLVY